MVHMKQAEQPKRARLIRKLGIAAAAMAFTWGVAWLALPRLIATQIEEKASQALGREVTVRSVDVAPWSLAVAVHGLEVAGLPGQAPALSIERAYINASATSLLRWAPVLDAVELDQPVLRLVQQASGHWDFEDVLAKLGADPQPQDPQAGPARVALYNIQVRDGRVELNDEVAGVKHTVEALQLKLPFISTLPSQREVKVQPQLSLRLNGSEMASEAVGTPFDTHRSTQAKLAIKQFDLSPYAAYLPAGLPVRLQQGVIDADIAVAFEQTEQPTLQLQGTTLELSDLKLQDAQGQPLAAWSKLKVQLGDTRPLQQQVRVASVVVDQPFAHIHRHADGAFLPGQGGHEQKVEATGTEAPKEETIAAQASWKLLVDQFDIKGGVADWRDDVAQVGAALRLDQLQLQVRNIAWPMHSDAQWKFQAQLQGADHVARGRVHSQGQGRIDSGQASLVVHQLDAQALQAYAKQWVKLPVGGLASLTAGVAWKDGQVHAQVPSLKIEAVALGQSTSPEVAWTGLQLRNLQLDSAAQQVHVEQIALEAPRARVQRNAQGRWMYEQWLQPVAGAPAKGKETVVSPAGKPWQVLVQDVQLAAGQVELMDESVGALPLAIKLSEVQMRMQNIDSLKGTAQSQLSANLAERTRRGTWGKPGQLSYEGHVQLAPLFTKGRVHIQALPLQAFESYMAPHLNVHVVRALASFDGDVQFAQKPKGPQLHLQGQVKVNDVHVQTVAGDAQASHAVQGPQGTAAWGAEDLLRWKQLHLQGLQVDMQPAQPPHIQVRGTDLRDFYARVVVLPQGRLNLQNIVKGQEEGGSEAAASPAALDSASVSDAPAARIDMGPIALRNGVIKFSDYFIQPNYTADLTALNGSLDAFSSQPVAQGQAPALAQLTLDGVAQGTAQLHIGGAINPLAQPLALDVRAQVQGLDLPPLTPYAIKYAGHGIDKGKLSMDVRYQVQPDGQLTASNQLVLNQLTFSEPVEGAPSTLPVRLAVALLADEKGVIDLNVPLSGSLNDPEFRVAPLVFKVLGNIVRKAVTAPFSLLTGAFASGDDKSDIAFESGRSILNEPAQHHLQQLAKAMNSKPQLKLTLIGQADGNSEAPEWKRAKIQEWMQGPAKEGVVERTEQQKLSALKQLYRETVKDRPRNLVGMTKDLPPQEMQAMIEQAMQIPTHAWQDLATARAQTVRDYLLQQGVDPQRVFLGHTSAKSANDIAPSVLLNISVQ